LAKKMPIGGSQYSSLTSENYFMLKVLKFWPKIHKFKPNAVNEIQSISESYKPIIA